MVAKFKFKCTGHKNISAMHDKTLEFTKDNFVTPTGDCILGINADFDYDKLKEWIDLFSDNELIKCKIELKNCNNNSIIYDEFEFNLDKNFCSEHEIVFRRSDFKSDRTLGIKCTKCACDIDRRIVEILKNDKENAILNVYFG